MEWAETQKKANLRIFLKGENPLCLEHVSLFPVNTLKNRQNGLRRHAAQSPAEVNPGLLRLQGG